MRRDSKYLFVGAVFVVVLIIIFFSVSFLINVGSDQLATVYVKEVSAAPNFNNPGGESFWSSVPSYSVPLIESVSYPGSAAGHTGEATVQMAWTASTPVPELMIRMAFSAPPDFATSPPTLGVPILNDTISNRAIPMYNSSCVYQFSSCYGGSYPQDVGFFPLAQNAGHTYPEQAIVVLGIAPGANTTGWYQVSYKPKMVPGTSGALGTGSGGSAEMWIWSRSPTDNSSTDSAYPGIAYPNGTAINPSAFGMPSHASYAIDGFTNATSFYQLGGVPPSAQFPVINTPQFYTSNYSGISNLRQMMNPFEVQAKGAYSNGQWVVEYVRSLTTSSAYGENAFQLQLNPQTNSNYFISFAVSQESAGQTYLIYYNSVSFWWRFNFQTTSGLNGYNGNFG
ncbi:MAG: hypothetical protein OK438_03310 [Thaumarchaeota archaeon]|nr:hypothetical protein [Nitrososphaerota archaeon]